MSTITRDVVERARQRAVEKPEILVQGTFARTSDGIICDVGDPKASCFCTLGLIANTAGITDAQLGAHVYDRMGQLLGDADRDARVDNVIEMTDGENNARPDLKACTGSFIVAGLAGFDYLLSTMTE